MLQFAERNGIKQIEWWMAGDQMRSILRSLNVKDLGLPHHQLGTPYGTAVATGPVQTTQLEDLQRAQWEAQKRDALSRTEVYTGYNDDVKAVRAAAQAEDLQDLIKTGTRAEMAKECKRRGIKMARTDTKEILAEKLNGK